MTINASEINSNFVKELHRNGGKLGSYQIDSKRVTHGGNRIKTI